MARRKERTELERIELANGQSLAAALAAMTGDAAYVVAPDGKRVAILVCPDALHDLSRELMLADLCTEPDPTEAVRAVIAAMAKAVVPAKGANGTQEGG